MEVIFFLTVNPGHFSVELPSSSLFRGILLPFLPASVPSLFPFSPSCFAVTGHGGESHASFGQARLPTQSKKSPPWKWPRGKGHLTASLAPVCPQYDRDSTCASFFSSLFSFFFFFFPAWVTMQTPSGWPPYFFVRQEERCGNRGGMGNLSGAKLEPTIGSWYGRLTDGRVSGRLMDGGGSWLLPGGMGDE